MIPSLFSKPDKIQLKTFCFQRYFNNSLDSALSMQILLLIAREEAPFTNNTHAE